MPERTPAWLDLKISLPTLITMVGCLIAGVTSYNKLQGRMDALQGIVLQQVDAVSRMREESERKDVAQAQRQAVIERLDRIERKLDVLR